MDRKALRVGTRGSDLALWQARWVAGELTRLGGREVELVTIRTRGDRVTDRPIAAVGTQGVFVREVQERLLAGEVDLVVHSMKDLETVRAEGIALAAVPPRGPVRDVLVAPGARALEDLPRGAALGTGSPRRRAQLLAWRGDLRMVPIRGNVPTRLRRVEQPGPDGVVLDGVVLAEAGLLRLGLGARIACALDLRRMLPAPGQGALAIECRAGDRAVAAELAALHDVPTAAAVAAERAFLQELRGGCHAPVGALARVEGGRLRLEGCVAELEGRGVARDGIEGRAAAAEELGRQLAGVLLERGAGEWIEAARC